MRSFIQLSRHLYEEPYHLNLVIIASNGLASGSLEFYTNPGKIAELGSALKTFPSHQRSSHLFEIGSEYPEDQFAFYLRLRVQALNEKDKCLF